MAREIESVKLYLRNAQKFSFHENWLEDCVQWAKESFDQEAASVNGLRELVREQWLLGDLREISPGCLPGWLTRTQVGLLSGVFTLQVNQVIDAGSAAYAQLEKLKGKEIIDEENQDNKANKKGWEDRMKPTRLLMLELTDGSQTVRAMEHHGIPCLNTGMQPGCKITISGDVRVRQGALLLNKDNVKYLGGQVDALVEERPQKKVLSDVLGVAVAPQQQRRDNMPRGAAPVQTNAAASSSSHTTARGGGGGGGGGGNHSNLHPPSEEMDFDEAMELDIAEQLEELAGDLHDHDDDAGSRVPNRAQRTSTHAGHRPTTAPGSSAASAKPPGSSRRPGTDSLARRRTDNQSVEVVALDDSDGVDQPTATSLSTRQARTGGAAPGQSRTHSTPPAPTRRSRFSSPGDEPPFGLSEGSRGYAAARNPIASSTPGARAGKTHGMPSNSSTGNNSTAPESRGTGAAATSTTAAVLPLAARLAAKRAQPALAPSPPAKRPCIKGEDGMAAKRAQPAAALSPPAKRPCIKAEEDPPCAPPFTYLKAIHDALPSFTDKYVWTKVFLGTLTSRLRNADGWCVRAIVNDGSDTMEVEFGNEVLVKLIGFTTLEQKALYTQAKAVGNPAIKARVLEGIQHCQKVLASLSCFLKLHFARDREFPLVVSMREPGSHDAELLLASARQCLDAT